MRLALALLLIWLPCTQVIASQAEVHWLDARGRPSPAALALLAELHSAGERGLDPTDYFDPALQAGILQRLREGRASQAEALAFEAALSTQGLRLSEHLRSGRTDPRRLGYGYEPPQALDASAWLARLATSPEPRRELDSLEPSAPAFRQLRSALVRYRTLAAQPPPPSFPALPARSLEAGDEYAGLAALAARLRLAGDLADSPEPLPSRYEGVLVEAVQRFQYRHGLEADGKIGARTWAALQVTPAQRAEQIALNLERWRWLSPMTGQAGILVNVPEQRLHAWDADSREALQMPVVIGMAKTRQTPLLASRVHALVFRPSWTVPPSILRRDLLAKYARDPDYFAEQGIAVIGSELSHPDAATLAELAAGRLKLRQRPGPLNAMGPVKFLFANPHSVYLHGTPHPELFERERRDLSSGCVRLQRPLELAEWLLTGQDDWDAASIQAATQNDAPTRTIALQRQVPIYLAYFTAVASADGVVRFYPDIYNEDAKLRTALARSARR